MIPGLFLVTYSDLKKAITCISLTHIGQHLWGEAVFVFFGFFLNQKRLMRWLIITISSRRSVSIHHCDRNAVCLLHDVAGCFNHQQKYNSNLSVQQSPWGKYISE